MVPAPKVQSSLTQGVSPIQLGPRACLPALPPGPGGRKSSGNRKIPTSQNRAPAKSEQLFVGETDIYATKPHFLRVETDISSTELPPKKTKNQGRPKSTRNGNCHQTPDCLSSQIPKKPPSVCQACLGQVSSISLHTVYGLCCFSSLPARPLRMRMAIFQPLNGYPLSASRIATDRCER